MKTISVQATINNQKINKRVSQLILGTAEAFQLDEKGQLTPMLEAFLEKGGNLLDTGHQYKRSEETLGKWLKIKNNRDRIQILTKGAHPDDGEPGNRLNPASIEKDLFESLERLNTNYIDFYALHRDDLEVEVGPIIEILNKHISAGKIHAIGTSNWNNERIEEANKYAEKNKLVGFTFNSPNLSLAKCNEPRWAGCVSLDHEGVNWHSTTNMPLFSWSSQAGGFFSGRFSQEERSDEEMVRVFYSPENWERYHRALILADEKNVSPIQIALAYVLNQTFPTAAIIGPQNEIELHSSADGANIVLTETEMKWVDLLVETR
ncbi:aldo/keto reductase [Salipaludibacillus neizhouensis]|uniref:Aldo/keto reductase n=1 Tax=Salipaludibacillus neizhouensis TaxID=885475 RepID=A0A3A9K3F8_9BACI|nr:aldo/keto reductase [Salipaludibacillus neizhouensis]RKL65012.1 aldo/keto reductase [Salipaludibacillus neizhouensis]